MRITIFAAGSRGDVQPCLMLALGLQNAGFPVTLAAPENFSDFVQAQGVNFHKLRGDVQQIMTSDTGRGFMEAGNANPIQSIRAMRTMVGQIAPQLIQDLMEACREAQALISLAVFAPFAKSISEVQGIPLVLVEPTPMLPTGDFPAAGWPLQRHLGRLHNRFSGFANLQIIWLWYRPYVNDFRKSCGLAPYNGSSFYRILASQPLLGAYSPAVIPFPSDWPASMHITGYWFPSSTQFQPPAALQAFLEAGEPPVYVGFGSMAGQDPEHFAQIVLKALEISGKRGMLLTGWGGLQTRSAPERVFIAESVPHDWLFPRMAAVVHHGGAGTTTEGLRSGVPSVIVPFVVDQPFWGKRVNDLGAGPPPILRQKLTADRLAHAIQAATSQPKIKQRAADLGKMIRAEDGVGNAVRLIEQILGG